MRRLYLVVILCVFVGISTFQNVHAQPLPDTDADGVIDANDACPNQPGPASNNGCPVEVPAADPATDGDLDGTPNDQDRCPDTYGPATNNGCPDSSQQVPDNAEPDRDSDGFPDATDQCPDRAGIANGCPLPSLDPNGECRVATLSEAAVNVRENPALDAPVARQLNPTQTYPTQEVSFTATGAWFAVEGGWVLSDVVRFAGICGMTMDMDNDGIDNADDTCPFLPAADTADGCPADLDRDANTAPEECPYLDVYTPEEKERLITAGIQLREICQAVEDAPDPVCDEVNARLSPEAIQRYEEAGIRLDRLCLPEDRPDAPCPLLGSLSADQQERYRIANVPICPPIACPAVATLSEQEKARLVESGVNLDDLCLPELPPSPLCDVLRNMTDAEKERYRAAGTDMNTLCTSFSTPNIPAFTPLDFPSSTMFLTAGGNLPDNPCPASFYGFVVVRLAGSPYTGPADIEVASGAYFGTECPELIFGTEAPNWIGGGGGNDVVIGFGGDDLIGGGSGDDIIFGMEGNDTLVGIGGNDILFGNSGEDRVSGGWGRDIVVGDVFTPLETPLTYWLGIPANANNPYSLLSQWYTYDVFTNVNVVGVPTPMSFIYGGLQQNIITRLRGHNSLTEYSLGAPFTRIKGGSGNDFLYGSAMLSQIYAGSGNDWIESTLPTNNVLNGEDGADMVRGSYIGFIGGGYDNSPDALVGGFDSPTSLAIRVYYQAGGEDTCNAPTTGIPNAIFIESIGCGDRQLSGIDTMREWFKDIQ